MTIDIKVPVLPESVADATIAAWHKKPGDLITRNETLVDIETDKVVLEVVAPADGVLEKIIKDKGSIVKAEEVIAVFSAGAVGKAVVKTPEATAPSLVANPATAVNAATPLVSSAPQQASAFVANAALSPSERRALGEGKAPQQATSSFAAPSMPIAPTTPATCSQNGIPLG